MCKYKLWICVVILGLLILSGCNKPAGNEVSLGEEFTLSVGQSAMVAGENLSIKFIEVTSDSRCPKGATCIWEGEASALIEITSSGSTYSKVMTQPGSSSSTKTSFSDYEITFDIQPYPELNKEIDGKDYRLELVISKESVLSGGFSQLIADLKKAGVTVQEDGEINQPFFSVEGKVVRIYSEDVQVFEYRDELSMQAEASQVSPTGSSIGTNMVNWVSAPHFYKTGKIIVLYVGNNTAVTEALKKILGAQFAGQ